MAELLQLSDDLLLTILEWLPLESYFCLVRTCHALRRLSYDPSLRRRFDPACNPVFFNKDEDIIQIHAANPQSSRRPLKDFLGTLIDLFNPPMEYMPPWPRAGRMKTIYGPGDTFASHRMTLHNICWNINTWENRHISNIAGLLLKDSLCSSCWNLRGTLLFTDRLRFLMLPLFCGRCQLFHARVFFPNMAQKGFDYDRACTGLSGHLRICDHNIFQWDSWQRRSPAGKHYCKPCKTTFEVSSGFGYIRREVQLPKEVCQSYFVEKNSLDVLRSCLNRCRGDTCPHINMNDPSLINYLLHTLQYYNIVANVEVSLTDFWGKHWVCPVCKASFSVLHSRTRVWGWKTKSQLTLVVLRTIPKVNLPTDCRWLAQLQPPTPLTRLPQARGILWCSDPGCGTSRGHRKEALLVHMLEYAFTAARPTETAALYPNERVRRLRFANRWFWNPMASAGSKRDHEWTKLDATQTATCYAIAQTTIAPDFPFGIRTRGESVWERERRKRRWAAICHAVILYDYRWPPVQKSLDTLVDIPSLDQYEAYIMGERQRPKRDFRLRSFERALSEWKAYLENNSMAAYMR